MKAFSQPESLGLNSIDLYDRHGPHGPLVIETLDNSL